MASPKPTATLSVDKSEGFPAFPGEDALAHAGTQWKESARSYLAARKLLGVANGAMPPGVGGIVDEPLLPALPEHDRNYHRRLEHRNRISTQNESNRRKRHTLILEAWTVRGPRYTPC